MIEVLFFAQVRERLDCTSLTLEYPAAGLDLDGLQDQLIAEHGSLWSEVLGQDNIIRAINQTIAECNAPLCDGDEVAFYPPVSGG